MDKSIIDALNWRYATKLFDPTKKISKENLDTLLETVRLAPSSSDIQPWKILVITDPEVRIKLLTATNNQSQVMDSSHLFVFSYRNEISAEYVDKLVESVAKIRNQELTQLDGYKKMIVGLTEHKGGPEGVKIWSSRQVYIALGMLLETAALLKIDACPMEGFKAKKFDEILGLQERGFSSVAMVALGYRAEGDKYATLAKARLTQEEVFEMA